MLQTTQKIYRYVETRDENGNIIDLKEVKSTDSFDNVAKLHAEVSKNQEKIFADNARKEKELQAKKEHQAFLKKYSLKNFMNVVNYLLVMGKFNDVEFIEHLLTLNEEEIAEVLSKKMLTPEFVEVRKFFDKF